MKRMLRAVLPLLLCLSLCLILFPCAFAEGTEKNYGEDTIVGFDTSAFSETIDLDHKYALVELKKQFPARLTVHLGGVVTYTKDGDGAVIISGIEGAVPQVIDVSWECVENYDKHGDVFHFVPVLGDYELADALEKPVITVNVLGQLPIPPLMPISMERERPTPWVISDDRRYDSDGYPSAYSNKASMPPIRDQNPYGTCWAFGTIAAVEGDLIHDGAADTSIDLSELHLAYFTYHDFYDEKGNNIGDTITINPPVFTRPDGSTVLTYLENGGSTYYASQTLANMLGPVAESQIPYSNANGYEPSADKGRLRGPVQVTDVYYIDAGDMGAVKDAIMAHGAVSARFHAADNNTENLEDFYSFENNSFYYPTEVGTNHIVSLVGWDDSFPASRFVTSPEGNGAWLVRNSWGDDRDSYWGYFWLSYYDKSLGNDIYAFDVQPWQYDHCYAYDNSPATFWRGAYNDGVVLSQTFQVDGGEQIEAIGFTLEDADTTVGFSLASGGKTVTATANSGSGGYHLVPLSEPLVIAERSAVTLEMEYISAPNGAYAYGEAAGSIGAVTASTACGSGGLLADGSIVEDANGLAVDGRLKLFTKDANISDIAINKTNFPDDVFRAYVAEKLDLNKNGYLGNDDIDLGLIIDCSGTEETPGKIASLKGIEFLTNLRLLNCSYNNLTELNLDSNTELQGLSCSHNNLTQLSIQNNPKLETLMCSNNKLSSLSLEKAPALKFLLCDSNQLETLSFKNNDALDGLMCNDNKLKSLDLNNCKNLTSLYCPNNALETLNISVVPKLAGLGCAGNPLTSVNLSSCPALVHAFCTAQPTEDEGIVTYSDNNNNTIICDSTLSLVVTGLLELPGDLTAIEEEAFAGGSFVYVNVPSSTVSIGPRAFADCPNLRYVFIHDGLDIDPSAFADTVITVNSDMVSQS